MDEKGGRSPETLLKIKDLFYDNVKYVQELKNTEKLAHTFTTFTTSQQ